MSADVTSGVAPLRVNFTGNVLDPEGANLTYAWDFDSNGTTDATTKDATHVYTAVGNYTAKLTATDRRRPAPGGHDPDRGHRRAGHLPGRRRVQRHVAEPRQVDRGARGPGVHERQRRQPEHHVAELRHPRRRHRAAQHRAPAAADLRALDGDHPRQLGPDDQLQQRGPDGLLRRRELHQGRHGLERRAPVRGVQGAQQHGDRPRRGDRRAAGGVPDHLVPAPAVRREHDPAGVLGRRSDLDELRRHDEPDEPHGAEDRRLRDVGQHDQP